MELLHESGRLGSLDIVELNPLLDRDGMSAKLLVALTARLFGERPVTPAPVRSELHQTT